MGDIAKTHPTKNGPHLSGPSLVQLPGIETGTEITLSCGRGTDAHFRTIGNDVGIEHPLRHRVLALDRVERRDGMGGADVLLAGFEIVPTTAPKPGSAAGTYSRCLQAGPPRSMRAKP